MKRSLLTLLIAVLSIAAVPVASNAETHSENYNGATCLGYPPFVTTNSLPFQNWLYGFRQVAYCHFTVPNTWWPEQISYVLVEGVTESAGDLMRIRLCMYYRTTSTCGTEKTLSGLSGVNWAGPPGTMPTFVTGAYLFVRFPTEKVSVVTNYRPVWSRPTPMASLAIESADLAVSDLVAADEGAKKWVSGLREAFALEPRDAKWAEEKEAALRDSASRSLTLPSDMLSSIECRQTSCRARGKIAASDGTSLQEGLMKVHDWASDDAECGFTLLHDFAGGAVEVEVIKHCGDE